MTHLVIGHPGPVATAVAQRLVARGERVFVVGPPGATVRTGAEVSGELRYLVGDVAKIDFGLPAADYSGLCKEVSYLYVAETFEQLPRAQQGFRDLEVARPVRVASEVAEFALVAGKLEHIAFLSSLSVFGDARGSILESDFEVKQSFSRESDEVLAVAEKQIHRLVSRVPRAIVRIANLVGHENSGDIFPGAELGRLSQFALAAPDVCDFTFFDRPFHFETVERAARALVDIRVDDTLVALHIIDDQPWTDRQVITWLFDRLQKRVSEVPKAPASVGQLWRAATIQSGRARASKADFQREAAMRLLPTLLARDIEATLSHLFGRGLMEKH